MPAIAETSAFLHRRGWGQLNITELTASQQAKGPDGSGLEARNGDEPDEIQGHEDDDRQLEVKEGGVLGLLDEVVELLAVSEHQHVHPKEADHDGLDDDLCLVVIVIEHNKAKEEVSTEEQQPLPYPARLQHIQELEELGSLE